LPYTYSWDNGDNDSIADNVAAGIYEVTITDGQGCVLVASEEIFEPTPLSLVLSATAVNCFGGSDGSAWVEILGGTPGYEVEWNNGYLNDTISSLATGNYVVDVLDRNDCFITSNINVSQPLQGLALNFNVTPVDCNGASTGLAEVLTTGGTYPYNYTWSNGANDSINENIPAGTYQVNIIDANGCNLNGSAIVNEPSLLVTNIVNVDSAFCELPNGSALITATGGIGPYTFLWSDGQTTAAGVNFIQGNYSVVTTDQNGCQNNDNITIGNIQSPIVTTLVNQIVSCFDGNDGSVIATGSLGNGNYQYSWAPSGNMVANPINLMEGDHIVTLTDGNGCQAFDTIYVGQNDQIIIAADTIINVSCFGLSDAWIAPNVVGGITNYTYSWSNGSTNDTVVNLPFGQHILTVTDNLGCQMTQPFNVSQPAVLQTAIGSFTNELCVDNFDGTATSSTVGGTFPYSYLWNSAPTQNAIIADSLAPGNYMVIVSDINGCSDSATVTIGSPSPVITTVMPDDTICYGSDIVLSATAVGGTGSYLYYWDNIGIQTNPVVSPTQLTEYVVTAIDGNGCSDQSDTLEIAVISFFQADLDVNANSPICPGLNSLISCQINSTTVGNVTYDWNPNIGNTAGTFNVIPPAPGYYTVTVTNECNVSISDSIFIGWIPNPDINIEADITFGCQPLTINFTDLSTTPVGTITSWLWDFGDGNTSTDSNPQHEFEDAGLHDISLTIVTDEGCVSDSIFIEYIDVYELPIADFTTEQQFYTSFDMNAQFINNSINATSYIWDFGDGSSSSLESPSHEYIAETDYLIMLTAISPEGCRDSIELPLRIIEDQAMYVPNTFTPNGDGVNDIFQAEGIGLNEGKFELWIYNRWGELIFFSTASRIGWDGTFNGEEAPMDTYVWVIRRLDKDNKVVPLRGHVNLIR
jgi:gliding motility-associated-like protein